MFPKPRQLITQADQKPPNRNSQKRLAELSTLQQTSRFNQVYPLQKVDYAREVTDASNEAFVLVNLTSQGGNVESQILTELWRQLAAKFGDVKFCEIRADMCIEGYPERNTPTILVYKDTEIRRQLVTLRELKGPRTKIEGKVLLCLVLRGSSADARGNRYRASAHRSGRRERKRCTSEETG